MAGLVVGLSDAMITSLAFVVYPVSDIVAARKFYEEILGLRLTHEFGGEWFEYDLGDTTFAITSTDADHAVPVRSGLAAFEVDDLNAEVARLEGMAIPLASAISETPVCRFARLHDPDGSEIILHQRKGSI
jgi:catechol 2,3-dioxygenase-like lactoylglutathione lyase family enzyme